MVGMSLLELDGFHRRCLLGGLLNWMSLALALLSFVEDLRATSMKVRRNEQGMLR